MRMVLCARCRETAGNVIPDALALMKETKMKRMPGIRGVKALSQVMRYRMTGECYGRVTREGLLEAVTFTLTQRYRSAFQAERTQEVQRPGCKKKKGAHFSEQQEGGWGWQQWQAGCVCQGWQGLCHEGPSRKRNSLRLGKTT